MQSGWRAWDFLLISKLFARARPKDNAFAPSRTTSNLTTYLPPQDIGEEFRQKLGRPKQIGAFRSP